MRGARQVGKSSAIRHLGQRFSISSKSILMKTDNYERKTLYYWQLEAKNSQAEVDYVIQQGETILPLEVKAGTKGAMQSMFLFLHEKNKHKGIFDSIKMLYLISAANTLK